MLDQDFGSKQQQARLHMQETREDGSTSAVHEKGSNPLSCVARLPLPCSPDSAWLEICGDTKRPRTGAAVSATPTSCMHQSAGLHGYLQHLRQAGQRVKHAHALRRALHLQRTHASPQPHQRHESGGSSAAAAATHCSPRPGLGEPLHSNEPSAGGALSFRIARPARCGARDAAIGSPPLLSTLLL